MACCFIQDYDGSKTPVGFLLGKGYITFMPIARNKCIYFVYKKYALKTDLYPKD
jgi:hypothetical protein